MSQNELHELLFAALSSGAGANDDQSCKNYQSVQDAGGRLDQSAPMTPADFIAHYDFRVVAMDPRR